MLSQSLTNWSTFFSLGVCTQRRRIYELSSDPQGNLVMAIMSHMVARRSSRDYFLLHGRVKTLGRSAFLCTAILLICTAICHGQEQAQASVQAGRSKRQEAVIDTDKHGSLRLSSPADIYLRPSSGHGLVIFGKRITSFEELRGPAGPAGVPGTPGVPGMPGLAALPAPTTVAVTEDNKDKHGMKQLWHKFHQLEKRLHQLEEKLKLLPEQRSTTVTAPIFFQMMTPDWMKKNAKFFETPIITSEKVAFIPNEIPYHRLLQIPLVSAGRLDADGTYLVSITIRHKKRDDSQPDNDLILMISDNTSCAGFWFMDQEPFVTMAGIPGPVLTKISRSRTGQQNEPATNSKYPELWQMRMRLTKQSTWGNVWAATQGEGHQSTYPRVLKPQQGLLLELYRDGPKEAYLINYIEVSIVAEN